MPTADFSSYPAILLLLGWCLVIAVLGAPLASAWVWLKSRGRDDERTCLVAPLVLLGLVGYVTCIAYFFDPQLGRAFAVATCIACWGYAIKTFLRCSSGKTTQGLPIVGGLVFAIGLFYLVLLYLPQLPAAFDTQSASRFVDPLPPDAILPEILGNLLYLGKPVRPFVGDWLSSDRPPLQTGLYLFVLPWLRLVHFPASLGYQCVGTFAQMLWVPALWILCRGLGLDRQKSFWAILMLAMMGLFVVNSVYVWPKLLAASYTLCAGALLLGPTSRDSPVNVPLAAACGGLGFIAHSSVSFALMGLIPIWIWRERPKLLHVGSLAVVILAFVLPWWLYQKFGDPPGNRLLKWHLAGAVAIDGRGLLTTLSHAYSQITWQDWWKGRIANLEVFANQPFYGVFDLFDTSATDRRGKEFFHGLRALGVLNLAWLVALVELVAAHRRENQKLNAPFVRVLGVWTVATWALWILLMFQPGSTYVHQSSYSMFMVPATIAVIILLRAPLYIRIPVLGWHIVYFMATWLTYDITGPLNVGLFSGMGISVVVIAWTARRVALSAP